LQWDIRVVFRHKTIASQFAALRIDGGEARSDVTPKESGDERGRTFTEANGGNQEIEILRSSERGIYSAATPGRRVYVISGAGVLACELPGVPARAFVINSSGGTPLELAGEDACATLTLNGYGRVANLFMRLTVREPKRTEVRAPFWLLLCRPGRELPETFVRALNP
jgi:hypothetical protein